MTLLAVFLIAQSFVFAGFCAFVAREKGRDGGSWFWLGLLFSLVALIALVGLPERRKE